MREALARLDAEGLVVKARSRGYTVTPPLSADEVADLYEFRLLVEPWAAGRAAAHATGATERRLLAELDACPEAPDDRGYAVYRAIADHDRRFHDLVLELAGNDQARQAFAHTNCHLHLFRLTYGRGMGAQALEEHRAVAQAIVRGDVAASSAAMRDHLARSSQRITGVLDSSRPPG